LCVKLPKELYFNLEDERSMPWKCDMPDILGWRVYTNPIESQNAVTLVCEGKCYKIIPFYDLYLAKKGDDVIMLNGNVLCTEIKRQALSSLDVTSEDKYEPDRAIVAFLGQPNECYQNPTYVEFTGELNVGDTILFDRKYRKIYLERLTYASKFSSTQLYLVVPRRRIACKL
jgi:hypothetical protein